MAGQADTIEAALLALIGQARNALAIEIAANLTEACPKDTTHASANFVPSVGSPFVGESPGADTTAAQAGVAAVLAAGPEDDVFVTNNVDYVRFLIAGSSSQAPAGWDLAAIDLATQEIQSQYTEIKIEVDHGTAVAIRGAPAAGNLASAYSPFGGDE